MRCLGKNDRRETKRERRVVSLEQTGTGFSFANYNADEMLDTIFYEEKVFYEQPKEWARIVRRGIEKDFS